MVRWLHGRSLPVRILGYAGVLILVFALAVAVGATVTLLTQGDVATTGEGPRAGDQQENPPDGGGEATVGREGTEAGTEPRQNEAAARREEEARYADAVGEIQADSVEALRGSHDRLLRYDSLTAGDVAEMQDARVALEKLAERTADLEPPERYGRHHEVFASAIDELREAARLAYDLSADPTAVTPDAFAEYDGLVGAAAADLRRSNELLGRDYETVENLQEIDTL